MNIQIIKHRDFLFGGHGEKLKTVLRFSSCHECELATRGTKDMRNKMGLGEDKFNLNMLKLRQK